MFGFGALMMWLHPALPKPGVAPEDPKLQFLVAWIIGTLFLLFGPARLKRVCRCDKFLRLKLSSRSNYPAREYL